MTSIYEASWTQLTYAGLAQFRKARESGVKTVRLRIGDRVRVSETLVSEYARASGVIVAIEKREAGVITLAECEVEFNDGVRRRFLGFQLTRLSAATET